MNWYCLSLKKRSIIDDRRGEIVSLRLSSIMLLSYAMVMLLLLLYDGKGLTEMDKDLVTQIIYHVQV